MEEKEHALHFAPDSPLFVRQLSMYSADLERLGEFILAMVKMMRQFQKDSAALAKSADNLGRFMRTGLGKSETNAHLLPFIKKFGEIFSEIASSQEILSESLESTFSQPLQKFCEVDISSIPRLQTSYLNLRDAGESSLQRYMQSDVSNFGRGTTQASLEHRAYDIVQHKRKFELARFDLVHKINEVESRKSLEICEACVSGMYALRSHHRICENRFQSCDAYITELQRCQEEEKEHMLANEKPLEKKRRDIAAVLDAMVERVEMAGAFLNDGSGVNSTGVPNTNSDTGHTGHRTPSPNPMSNSSFSNLSRMGYNFIGGLAKNMGVDKERGRSGHSNFGGPSTSSVSYDSKGSNKNSGGIASMTMEARPRRSSFGDTEAHGDFNSDGSQIEACENCEARMKALDNSELNPFYRISAAVAPAGLVKQVCLDLISFTLFVDPSSQGYLWKRSDKQKLLENWKRQWFVLDEAKLYFIKERASDAYSSFQVQTVCDLMLASVREDTDCDLPFCFRVSNANVDSIVVQAEGQRDYLQWLQELRNAIERRLSSGHPAIHAPKSSEYDPNRSKSHENDSSAEKMEYRELSSSTVKNILKRNPRCAECERSSPPPEWASLNLGCIVCIDCSGVHRAMGVHVSKMRSLRLDDLEPEEYEVLELTGNSLNNAIWESTLPPSQKKPSPSATFAVREAYIRKKYEEKKYLDIPTDYDMSTCVADIVRACEINDISLLMKSIAFGGPACLLSHGTFPLHVAAKRDSSACCMLLLVNGCDVLQRDGDGRRASEVAKRSGHEELSSFLLGREDAAKKNIGEPVLTGNTTSTTDGISDKSSTE